MKKIMMAAAALSLLLIAQCKNEDNKPLVLGKWKAVSWAVNGNESGRDASSVRFEFRPDDTYSASYGAQSENGSWRVSGDKLYTTGENKIEKAVKLAKITADTMIMDMNRVGTAETLVLVKE